MLTITIACVLAYCFGNYLFELGALVGIDMFSVNEASNWLLIGSLLFFLIFGFIGLVLVTAPETAVAAHFFGTISLGSLAYILGTVRSQYRT